MDVFVHSPCPSTAGSTTSGWGRSFCAWMDVRGATGRLKNTRIALLLATSVLSAAGETLLTSRYPTVCTRISTGLARGRLLALRAPAPRLTRYVLLRSSAALSGTKRTVLGSSHESLPGTLGSMLNAWPTESSFMAWSKRSTIASEGASSSPLAGVRSTSRGG